MHFTERSQLPMCYSTICLCREKGMEIPGQWFLGMWPSQNTETSAELKVSNYGVANFKFDTNWRQKRQTTTNRHQNNKSIRATLTGAPWNLKKPKSENDKNDMHCFYTFAVMSKFQTPQTYFSSALCNI